MKLYASGEDYLEAILVLKNKLGMVRSVDVARHLEVTKPSVCHAVATLRDGGFLTMDSDYFLHLPDGTCHRPGVFRTSEKCLQNKRRINCPHSKRVKQ